MVMYAVAVCLEVPGSVDDDAADRLVTALAPYSGALAHTEGAAPTLVDLVLDIEAEDPAAASVGGLRAAREVLRTAGLPATGEATGIQVETVADQGRATTSTTPPPRTG